MSQDNVVYAALESGTPFNYGFADSYPTPNVGSSSIIHKDFIVVPENESDLETRKRFRGAFSTQHTESYFTYVKERIAEEGSEKSRTFVEAADPQRELKSKTILNFGEYIKPGHADDYAVLALRKDPVFEYFKELVGTEYTATKFAEALEDFLNVDIEAFNEGENVAFPKAIQAIRNAKIEVLKQSSLNTNGLGYEASDTEKAGIKAEQGALPDALAIKTPLYLELPEQTIQFRVSVRFQEREGQSTIAYYSLKPVGLLVAYLKAAEQFKDLVSKELQDVSIGSYSNNR